MRTQTLSEVAVIHGGGRLGLSGNDFVNDGFAAYGAAGLNGQVTQAEYSDQDAVILSSIGARCGKCFLVSGAWTSLANTQVIIPNKHVVDARFLWYQLNDERRWHRSGSAQPFIKPADAKSHPVWVPSLDEQRRIAAILDQADALRAKRRQMLDRFESLAHALFNEARRAFSVRDVALGDIARLAGGASLPAGQTFVNQTGGSLLMKVSDMNASGNERTILKAALWTNLTVPASSTVGVGAVVLPKRGASIATNKKRVVTRQTTLDPNLMGITPIDDQLTSDYLFAWLNAFDLASITSGSSIPQLNKQDLAPLLIPLPSRADQLKFSARVSRLELARTRCLHSLTIADDLFASLRRSAFRGEL